MKFKYLIYLLISFAIHQSCLADSPIRLESIKGKVTTSQDKSCYIAISPGIFHRENDEVVYDIPPKGVVYQLQNDGTSKKMWQLNNFFASNVFLSNDCQNLIRMGEWAFGQEPSHEDLAVSFYKNGKFLRQYSTKDLVKDNKKVLKSTSHYSWADERSYKLVEFMEQFTLKTRDNIEYNFNIHTGQIVKP